MASWDPEAETSHPLDFRLVRESFVVLFWRTSVLDGCLQWLQAHAYRIVDLDAGSWSSADDMYTDIAAGFDFPAYFGRNLNALGDCMGDVASGDCGWNPTGDAGIVLVLRGFDSFAAADRRAAEAVMEIVARRARSAILIGHRLMCLVQSDDPRLAFERIGAQPVVWNDAEWLDSDRRP